MSLGLLHHIANAQLLHGCRAGVQVPTVEVRFDNISVNTSVYVGSRALPSVINSYRNIMEVRCSSPCTMLC